MRLNARSRSFSILRASAPSAYGAEMRVTSIKLLFAAGLAMSPVRGHTTETISFAASDGVQVFADYYSAGSKAKPLILLFHQAGSNCGEYAIIGPMLATLGFNALAIDQRSGGNAWGRTNETVKRLGKSTDYGEALLDLEAALQWAKSPGQTGSILVWGSSYSAALVFLLAAEHRRDIKAILSFSPGEYLRGASTVRKAAAQVSIPIFVTSAKDLKEIAVAKSILDVSPSGEKTQFVPQIAGVHGSSTLREDQNPDGAEENWAAVKQFLAKFSS
jgi:dienelactone hydrolase